MHTPLQITAIPGSIRAGSTSTMVLLAAAALAPAQAAVTLYEGLGDLPQFTPEFEDEPPPTVAALRALLHASDGVIICTPEYAHGMPGSLKNLIDCVVTSGGLWRKPVVTISASPSAQGGHRAHAWLLQTLGATEANVVASITVPHVRQKVDASGNVSDEAFAHELRAALGALVAVSAAQRNNVEPGAEPPGS